MCGIAGIVNSNKDPGELENIGSLMINQLHHRGPDGSGIKIINKKDKRNILMAHTRLKDLLQVMKQLRMRILHMII